MILIADSGSTKTDWRIIQDDGQIQQAKTLGFNPFYQDREEILYELQNVLLPQIASPELVTAIHFYGAGCSTEKNILLINEVPKMVFPVARVNAHTDMLAAARAVCLNEPGIVGILGTGSNTCLYDGDDIVYSRPNLGFILGDEGSGSYMGKALITAYLYGDLPAHLLEKFTKRYNDISRAEILENIYKKPFPNRYLASFSRFLYHNLKDPFIYRLVYESFSILLDKHIMRYENLSDYKVHFVGSVAFYYSNILRQVANDKGVTLRNIMETPIAGLTLYHQKKIYPA